MRAQGSGEIKRAEAADAVQEVQYESCKCCAGEPRCKPGKNGGMLSLRPTPSLSGLAGGRSPPTVHTRSEEGPIAKLQASVKRQAPAQTRRGKRKEKRDKKRGEEGEKRRETSSPAASCPSFVRVARALYQPATLPLCHLVMDHRVNHFFHSIQLRQSQESPIHGLLQAELPKIIARRCNGHISNECLLADIGDFLAIVLDILSELAHVAVHGQYIREYSYDRKSSLEQEPDLHTTDYLDDKYEGLRQITSKLQSTAKHVNNTWKDTPPVPNQRFQPRVASPREHTSSPSHNYMASRHGAVSEGWGRRSATAEYQQADSSEHNYGQNEASPGMSEDSLEVPSIEQLRTRGKGVYTCPHKEKCRKGGVHADGTIKIFSRNSEFRAHLSRHEKLFKCDLPGCPNNGKGFARSDQLERHKQKVKHAY